MRTKTRSEARERSDAERPTRAKQRGVGERRGAKRQSTRGCSLRSQFKRACSCPLWGVRIWSLSDELYCFRRYFVFEGFFLILLSLLLLTLFTDKQPLQVLPFAATAMRVEQCEAERSTGDADCRQLPAAGVRSGAGDHHPPLVDHRFGQIPLHFALAGRERNERTCPPSGMAQRIQSGVRIASRENEKARSEATSIIATLRRFAPHCSLSVLASSL